MNSTAKYSFALLTTGALGATAIVCALAACSVSSGTVDDLDGGHNTSSSSGSTSSSTSSSSSSSGSTTDGGNTCPKNTSNIIIDSNSCQTCLNDDCCDDTAACFNIKTDTASGKQGCEEYSECLSQCDTKAEDGTLSGSVNDCKDLCRTAAVDQVPALYDTYRACREKSCTTRCVDEQNHQLDAPDAGKAQ